MIMWVRRVSLGWGKVRVGDGNVGKSIRSVLEIGQPSVEYELTGSKMALREISMPSTSRYIARGRGRSLTHKVSSHGLFTPDRSIFP